LCQGLSWFKRLAAIGFLVMLLKVSFSYPVAIHWPKPEAFVLASTFALLAWLLLLFWKKDLSLPRQSVPTSPWNHEFILYLTLSAAFVLGNYCFTLSDLLVMQRYFSATTSGDAYAAAERLAFSLPTAVAPLLTVLFTNRSSEHSADALRAQLKLIAVFAFGLLFGAVCLFALRHLCLQMLAKDSPEAAAMIPYLSSTMIFVGLLQAIGTWALASRWSRIALLYGALGIVYTALILVVGKTPEALLHTMPIAAGAAFAVLLGAWMAAMRRHRPLPKQ